MGRRLSVTLLGLAIALGLAAPAAAEPLAVIASIRGRVEVAPARGGETQRAAFGRPLERGDRVSVAAGAAATLFFHDGNVLELTEKSTMTVGGRSPGGKNVGGLSGDVYAQVSRFATGGSRQTGLVALAELRSAPASDSAPIILAPRRTTILDTRPAFSWRPVAGAVRYRVVLSSAAAGELWSREAEGETLAYPGEAAALEADGDYLWELQALSEIKTLRRESTVFHVASAEHARAVRGNLERIDGTVGGADSPAARFLAGSYLFGLGFYRDAAEHFRALGRLSPASPAPHEALGSLYATVGLMDLAAVEFQQALALTREP